MKQVCMTQDDIKVVHDNESVTMYIVNYYCCSDEKEFDYIINFCPVCGFQPERLSEKTSKEDATV